MYVPCLALHDPSLLLISTPLVTGYGKTGKECRIDVSTRVESKYACYTYHADRESSSSMSLLQLRQRLRKEAKKDKLGDNPLLEFADRLLLASALLE